MEFNKIIFPAPDSSYTLNALEDKSNSNLIIISKLIQNRNIDPIDRVIFIKSIGIDNKKYIQIPCLFLPYFDKYNYCTKNFMLFFHGNAEDIGNSYNLLSELRFNIKMNVISLEYPNYGIYKSSCSTTSE